MERYLKRHDEPPTEAFRIERKNGRTIIEAKGRCMICGHLFIHHEWKIAMDKTIQITSDCDATYDAE